MDISEYRKVLSRYRAEPFKTENDKRNSIQSFLSLLDNVERSSIALFDMTTIDYAFLTSNLKYLKKLPESDSGSRDMSYFFSRVHEADRELFMDTSIKTFNFLYSKRPEERKDYKICQDFRIQKEDGQWIRLSQQMLAIELDDSGNIRLILLVNDVSPIQEQTLPGRRYMEHIPTGKRVLFPESDAAAQSPLTKRELEILGLVSNGYPSKEIAALLGISSVTVNNHRQNILLKLNVNNSAEAVNYARNIGIMD